MATTTIYPIADVTTDWETSTGEDHYTEIDEGTESPNDADYIETSVDEADEVFTLGTTPANTDEVSEVSVSIRGKITDTGEAANLGVELYHSVSTKIGDTQYLDGDDFGGYGTLGTDVVTWDGLSLTKAQADTLSVKLIFNVEEVL